MLKPTLFCSLVLASAAFAADSTSGVWTETDADGIPQDYAFQGEYATDSDSTPGDQYGVQVISLGKGKFQAVIYPGGLPGAGWDGERRSLMHGELAGGKVNYEPAEGNRKYLAKPAEQFSASKKFPPEGHNSMTGTSDGKMFELSNSKGVSFKLTKVVRKSPTLGEEAPKSATVLFDGSSTDAFTRGRIDDDGDLHTDGKDILTKQKFNDYKIHVEFMLPYRPEARGQGRANSGFYQVDHYEVQILDSFGLEGVNNECGGVYTKADPLVNMCLPPLQWQTYDVEFQNARVEDGKVVEPATMTVRHNGVVIHDKLQINGKTGGSRNDPLGTPGPLKFQGHGNPVQFRNIWVIAN